MSDVCRGCGRPAVRVFFDLGLLPLAGAFLSSRDEIPRERRYPLVISVCDQCGLVQIVDPVDPGILFHDYAFATGTVPGLVAHFQSYAEWLTRRFRPSTVLEFGANDGTLLEALAKRGIRALGIDLAPNIAQMARAQGRDVIVGAFGPEMVDELRSHIGAPDVITGSNVFAHNAHPERILAAADSLLADDGVLCLEVMYAGDLLERLQWDTLYHEHLTFYSLRTLATLLGRHGFEVVRAERVPMHGGSLRIAAARVGRRSADDSVAQLERWENEVGLNLSSMWDSFARESRRRIDVFGATMARLAKTASIWAYGAAGKATMWINVCHMDYLEAVVDASPLRAGKLMPGSHTPIVSPQRFRMAYPDYVFASAWNYLPAIRANEPQYDGYWIVPLPEMRVC